MARHTPHAPRRRPAREIEVINEISKAVTSTLDLSEIMRTVLERIKTLAFAEASSLLLYDAVRDELVFAATETLRESTFEGRRAGGERGLAAWVARTGRSAIVNDPDTDARCVEAHRAKAHRAKAHRAEARGASGACEGRHLLAVPIAGDGRVAGVIELADPYDGRAFDAADQAALERTAAGFGGAIDPARLARDPELVRRILAAAVEAVPSQAAALRVYDLDGRQLAFSASRRLEAGVVDGLRLPTDRGIAGWVARHREPVLLADAGGDPRHDRSIGAQANFRTRGMICVPLACKGTLHGVIQVMNRLDGRPFTRAEFRLVQILADHAAIAIENASLYRQAETAALTDDLTGLGNSRHLNRVLPALIDARRPLALLVLDFDNFKQVVDRNGHLIGSRTIAFLGEMMGRLIRPGDFAARFGGDEFVVVLPDSGVEAGMAVAERLRAAVAACDRLAGTAVDLSEVTASVGVAAFPDHAADADGLLRAADAAMYTVKRGRKNGVAVAGR